MINAASSALPERTVRSPAGPRRRRAAGIRAETTEQHVDDAAVHPLAHDVGQDRTRRADQRPGNDQRQILDGKADACRRPAGVAVQHRHHDRHVGAADRNDDQEADTQRQERDQPEQHLITAGTDEPDHQQQQHDRQTQVQPMLAGKGNRRATHKRLQFCERDQTAGEGDGTDRQAHRHLDQALGVDVRPECRC